MDALKKGVWDKLAPVTGDAQKAVEAIKTGDTKALKDKEGLKKKAEELKKPEAPDLFKKKKTEEKK